MDSPITRVAVTEVAKNSSVAGPQGWMELSVGEESPSINIGSLGPRLRIPSV